MSTSHVGQCLSFQCRMSLVTWLSNNHFDPGSNRFSRLAGWLLLDHASIHVHVGWLVSTHTQELIIFISLLHFIHYFFHSLMIKNNSLSSSPGEQWSECRLQNVSTPCYNQLCHYHHQIRWWLPVSLQRTREDYNFIIASLSYMHWLWSKLIYSLEWSERKNEEEKESSFWRRKIGGEGRETVKMTMMMLKKKKEEDWGWKDEEGGAVNKRVDRMETVQRHQRVKISSLVCMEWTAYSDN